MTPPPSNCPCLHPPFQRKDFAHRYIGTDEEGGRFADVSLEECITCGSYWLHYGYSVEGFSGSGRWYRVQVDKEDIPTLTVASAVQLLQAATEYFYGGSYYQTTGKKGSGKITLG